MQSQGNPSREINYHNKWSGLFDTNKPEKMVLYKFNNIEN